MNRMDENTGIFLEGALKHVSRKMYAKSYPELRSSDLIPLFSEDVDEGAKTFSYEELDYVGAAAIIANYADDIPMVDLNAEEVVYKIKEIATGFTYARKDVESAMRMQKNLPARKAIAARDIWERTIDRLAWIGDASCGMPGFFSHPNISTGSVVANGSGDTDWDSKTPAEMLDDMNGIVVDQIEATNGMEVPNVGLLSPKRHAQVATTTMKADGSGDTILKHFLENNPYIERVEPLYYCQAGQNGVFTTDCMAVYRADEEKLARVIPQFIRLLPPEIRKLYYEIYGSGTFAGTVVFKPLSVRIYDSLSA